MTGWGQDGPLAARAGHDINYIALSGALHAIGRAGEAPVPPLNLVGDFGGGGMLLAFGIACGVIEARSSGRGQVVDAAMDRRRVAAGDHVLRHARLRPAGARSAAPTILDSGAPWYDTYETRDGKFVAIGAIEPSSTPSCSSGWGSTRKTLPRQHRPRRLAGAARALRGAFAEPHARRVVRGLRRLRRLLRAGAQLLGIALHPHVAAARVDRARRHRPAGAGAALRSHPGRVRRPPPERGEGGAAALHDWGSMPRAISRARRARRRLRALTRAARPRRRLDPPLARVRPPRPTRLAARQRRRRRAASAGGR
jgi:alpha-methylacyl-CoA racemase